MCVRVILCLLSVCQLTSSLHQPIGGPSSSRILHSSADVAPLRAPEPVNVATELDMREAVAQLQQGLQPRYPDGGWVVGRAYEQLVREAEAASRAAAATATSSAKPAQAKAPNSLGQPLVIGLSHKTATVDVREKLAIPESDWNAAAAGLCQYDSIYEAAVLSTCNRFELYIVAEDYYMATRDVMEFLKRRSSLTDEELRPNLFMLQNEDATWHLLRVSAGLDSLVVGEGQILSQVKACYSRATAPVCDETEIAGSAGKVLGRLLNSAVSAGKYVRSETQIAKGAVSISSAAVELAIMRAPEDMSGQQLQDLRVTIVGAGKMSRLLLTHLASHGVKKVTLLNRSRPRAEELAAEYPDMEIEVLLMDVFWDVLERTDLAFTSTSSTGCLITEAGLQEGVWGKQQQKLMAIDISVPRNVESECNNVDSAYAYNVDDLKQVVAANQARRAHKVLEAEMLLRVELAKFTAWQESLKYVPAIGKLQGKFESTRKGELAKAQKKALKGLSEKQMQAVDVVTKSIINKLLHGPMAYLRSDDNDGSKATVQQIEEVFMIGDD